MTSTLIPLASRGQAVPVAARIRTAGSGLVVLLHGLGCGKDSFDGAFTAPALRGYSLCAIDFPGHGDSARNLPTDFHVIGSYAAVTRAVISRVAGTGCPQSEQVTLAGHGLGAAVATIAAENTGAAVISIEGILAGTGCPPAVRRIAGQTAPGFTAAGHAAFLAELRASGQTDLLAWARQAETAEPAAMHAAASSLVRWSDSGQLLRRFTRIPRTACLHGDRSGQSRARPRLDGTSITAVPAAGHFPMTDNPDEFYPLLAAALERCFAEGRPARAQSVERRT